MGIFDKLKISSNYPELIEINLNNDIYNLIINDKKFNKIYNYVRSEIIKYVNICKKYTYDSNLNNEVCESIENLLKNDNENSILQLKKIINKNIIKLKLGLENYDILDEYFINIEQISDETIRIIFEMIKNCSFERLLKVVKQINEKIDINKICFELFSNEIWDEISKYEDTFKNLNLLNLLIYQFPLVKSIIKNNYYDGLVYTLKHIKASINFISNLSNKNVSIKQFSMDFINKMGNDCLEKLYLNNKFSQKEEYDKIFKIYELNNSELITDAISFYNEFSFYSILDTELNRKFIEINLTESYLNRKERILYKYFGLKRGEMKYLNLFLSSISEIKTFPTDFTDKYNNVKNLLSNIIYCVDENELLEVAYNLDESNRDNYKKSIEEFEKDGNILLQKKFCDDLKQENIKMLQQVIPIIKEYEYNNGEKTQIDVYEFTGQPFTMLIHKTTNNNMENILYFKSVNIEILPTLLIANNCYPKLDSKNIIYGFNNIISSTIKYTQSSELNVEINPFSISVINMRNWDGIPSTNTITSINVLIQKTIEEQKEHLNNKKWNQVGLGQSENNNRIKPDFIVCFDKITDDSVTVAQKFNIPIYLINTKYYDNNF